MTQQEQPKIDMQWLRDKLKPFAVMEEASKACRAYEKQDRLRYNLPKKELIA